MKDKTPLWIDFINILGKLALAVIIVNTMYKISKLERNSSETLDELKQINKKLDSFVEWTARGDVQ